jgi:hypothetical protein
MLSKLQKVSEEFNVAVLMTNQECRDKIASNVSIFII